MLHRANVVVSFCFAVFTIAASGGCSSSDTGSPGPTDGGSDTAKEDVGTDTNVPFFDAGADSGLCWLITSSKPAQAKCDACSQTKCKTQREACYGSSYLTGTWGGSCGDYAKCECGCSELDDICQENCQVEASAACSTCLKTIDDCETANCKAECTPF